MALVSNLNVDLFGFHSGLRIVKRENGNSFLGGGGREGGVTGSRNFGGNSTSFKLSTTKDSQKLWFSYSVTPPPRVSGSAPDRRWYLGTYLIICLSAHYLVAILDTSYRHH